MLQRYTQLFLALGGLVLAGAAAADPVLIHSEPVRSARIHATFKVNPTRGVAVVHLTADRDTFGEEYNLYSAHVIKHVDGLTYNQDTRELRYRDTLCGTLRDHSFLGIKRHSVKETGSCKLVKTETKTVVDNGFDVHHRPLTEIHLEVVDG